MNSIGVKVSQGNHPPITMKQFANLDRNTLLKILDNSYDEIFVTDANGVVIYVNPICEQHYGLKAANVLGRKAESLDIRIICATNRDLHAMVANGSFRSDLYHG